VPILAPSAYTEAMNPNAAPTSRRYPVGHIGPVNGPYPTYGQPRRERCRHTSGRRVGISHEGEFIARASHHPQFVTAHAP
jgi:hypothetical protein